MPSTSWAYDNAHEWPEQFKTGHQQSPINILVELDGRLPDVTGRAATGARQRPRRRLDSLEGARDEHERSPSTDSSSVGSSHAGEWPLASPEARPDEQSPRRRKPEPPGLQLERQSTRACATNKKIFLGYPRYLARVNLCNTGHGWQVSLPGELADHTLVCGPPFGDKHYRLAQLHCHWGETCNQGSEHQINGKSFAAEIHFVHWNCTDFRSLHEASAHKHGLAVLAVLIRAMPGEHHRNRHLDKIAQNLSKVERPGDQVNLESTLDLKKLFPVNRWRYASYEGSLTTPPLSEVVDWIVFLEPIKASESQIELFRQLECRSVKHSTDKSHSPGKLVKNFRPVQPLNGRLVSIWNRQTEAPQAPAMAANS